jgi:hypothetical protein
MAGPRAGYSGAVLPGQVVLGNVFIYKDRTAAAALLSMATA